MLTDDAPWGSWQGFSSIEFQGQLWALGFSSGYDEAWRTSDGESWEDMPSGGSPNLPVVVFDERMCRLRGDDITCTNAAHPFFLIWELACPNCPSSSTRHHAAASFNGKLWQLGGYYFEGDFEFAREIYYPDVYSFTDASGEPEWTLVTDDAPWGPRAFQSVVVFDDKMWLLGGTVGRVYGYEEMNDVWYTEDGENWVLATPNADWCPRSEHATVIFRDRMWILGGYDAHQVPMNDVWSSADGVHWRQETAAAPWPIRANHAAAVFQDKIYVMGGDQHLNSTDHSDIWVYTPEGEGEGVAEGEEEGTTLDCEGEGEGASGPVPVLGATPQFLVFVPNDIVEEISIYNTTPGCTELNFTITTSTPWLSFSETSGTTRGCDDPVIIEVTSSYGGDCFASGSFTITSNGGDDSIGVSAVNEFCTDEGEGDGGGGEGEGEGQTEAEGEGGGEGEGQTEAEGEGSGDGEGQTEAEGEGGDGEGQTEAEGEGEGDPPAVHSADQNGDNAINLSELLRVIQFFNSTGLGCDATSEDGYAPDEPDTTCTPHASDYNPQDWSITLSELLRAIQFYNSDGFTPCPDADPPTEDGFCPVTE